MKKILVIEDSKIINNVVTKELQKFDFRVEQAFSFAQAKAFLQDNDYNLIILDLHLPDGEGSELIANIQSLTKTKVVVLTSLQDEQLREELFQYGILDYIIKDKNLLYSISEIIKIIQNIILSDKEKILIIDDSKFICKQVKTILEPRNYKLTSAYDAKMALKKLKEEEYKLIILDMELPDMHGTQLLGLMRKDIRLRSVPILVLSGTSTPEIIRQVLKNGANDFLKKPFVFEEFILKVDLWIDYFKKDKELREQKLKLKFVNDNLEKLVVEEIEKNRQKDKIMFAQSRQAQMGEVLGMVAHQWKQPLNAISISADILNLKMMKGELDFESTQKVTDKIKKYIKHLMETMEDFQGFFSPQKEKIESDFKIIFYKALTLVEEILKKKKIEVILDIKELQTFKTYENEIVQVVLNLMKNAQDILEEKKIKNPYIKVEIDKNSISISDNAGGIPKESLTKVFQPYFSTKQKSGGTGIGLYMSQIIIEEHVQGKLEVENTDEGAKFTITL
jgi:DNA-binding response OmpR family regulator